MLRPRNILPEITTTAPFEAFLDDIESIGVRPTTIGGHLYAVVAARSNLRWWLLPLEGGGSTSAGLEMLQPVTMIAALAKSWVQTMARFGLTQFVGKHLRLRGTPDLGTDFGGRATTFAYFTGTCGPHRKTSIQIMDVQGRIVGYAKISRDRRVAKFIEREANFIHEIRSLNLRSADLPQVMASRQSESYSLLVTDGIKSSKSKSPTRLRAQHYNFLKEMAERTCRRGAQKPLARLSSVIADIEGQISHSWMLRFRKIISLLVDRSSQMMVSYAHGDFTSWNTFEQTDQLYVFDWEYAAKDYPVGYDHSHFLIESNRNVTGPALASLVEHELSMMWFGGDVEMARYAALLSLAIHAAFYFERSILAGEDATTFERERLRAQIIDYLLERAED